jgi:hypothetical protein
MTALSPHPTPSGNPELAWLVAMAAAVLVAYGFAKGYGRWVTLGPGRTIGLA